MKPEEFIQAAECMMTTAVNCLVAWAFQAMPAERVERAICLWMDNFKEVAVRAVRERMAEGDRRH